MENNVSNVSIGLVVALIGKVAKKIAIQYGSIGVKNITVNDTGTGINVELVDGTIFPLIFTEQMLKKTYDTINDGTIGVDNARKLGTNEPSFYLDSLNINYDNTIENILKSTKVQDAIDELITLVQSNDTEINSLNNIDVVDYKVNAFVYKKLSELIVGTDKLITESAVKSFVKTINDAIEVISTDTETNNTAIHNIIKGDYITTVNTEENNNHIKLIKSENGVIIDDNAINLLVNQLKEVSDNDEIHFMTLDEEVGAISKLTDDLVDGKYIEIENGTGLNISKVHTKGVVIGANKASKLQHGTVQIGEGIDVDSNGVISVLGGGNGYIPKSDENTIYVSTTGGTIDSGHNGTIVRPFNNIANAMESIDATKTIIKFMDGQYYSSNGINIPVDLYKLLAGDVNIRLDNGSVMDINSIGSYIELGSFTGNILINSDCTLIIRGELKGTISIANGVKPYIRVNRYDEKIHPMKLTSANLQGGSVIGRYQFNMIAR